MKFYTSDLHIGHANVLKFDNRPFKDLDEMHAEIIRRWNSVVTKADDVYIIGDAIWNSETGIDVVKKLNGRKHLIRGNHDRLTAESKRLYVSTDDYLEIKDVAFGTKHNVIMCHYPIPFYRSSYDPHKVMLYGHVHATAEASLADAIRDAMRSALADCIEESKIDGVHRAHNISRAQFFNAGCMLHDYTPQTLEQITLKNDCAPQNEPSPTLVPTYKNHKPVFDPNHEVMPHGE